MSGKVVRKRLETLDFECQNKKLGVAPKGTWGATASVRTGERHGQPWVRAGKGEARGEDLTKQEGSASPWARDSSPQQSSGPQSSRILRTCGPGDERALMSLPGSNPSGTVSPASLASDPSSSYTVALYHHLTQSDPPHLEGSATS